MSKKHDAIFDDVLSGLDSGPAPKAERAGARFLNRSNRVAERASGDVEEKSLRWVDPEECRMWKRHNRAYELLTEDNCRDLIDGIRSQGRQEFPAIVRKTSDPDQPYEVICGARRHFAIKWLRANNYPQFRYLVDLRELTDEEAFRLGDIENRDREDISDYERARDYSDAVTRYYGGKQKAMAARLEVSEAWLSRYLQLSKLPDEIVAAFPSIREIKELHARTLKPFLGRPEDREKLLETAKQMAADGVGRDGVQVMNVFKAALKPPVSKKTSPMVFQSSPEKPAVTCMHKGKKIVLEFPADASQDDLHEALTAFMLSHFAVKDD
ncbi:ParB/RepB/Spo0J family partition protein [Ruegeria sp. Alg231-54]|uniref:ParB/RepB/Spo0J family partition protein n=1 Tax=Ruegeria sp. Alg231-54 TaxID=1922221 RepID=UPI000D5618AC|nr:ParB/RepB/Spo0J family partition protein [Ruegeria sp. Alg231-54]